MASYKYCIQLSIYFYQGSGSLEDEGPFIVTAVNALLPYFQYHAGIL